jgi:hypothetical protein
VKIVEEEEVAYHTRIKERTSDSILGLFSAVDALMSGELTEPFRPSDMKNKFQDGLKSPHYYLRLNRNLNWLIGKNMLKKVENSPVKRGPGRTAEKETMQKISGVKSYYSSSGYLDFLKKFVCMFVPRVIIYVRLRDSKILIRMLTVMQFGKLMSVRNMSAEEFIEGYMKQFPADRSSFKENKYNEDQKRLQQKNKKEILKLAAVDAEQLFQQLSWRSTLYSEFFVFGGLSYYEP